MATKPSDKFISPLRVEYAVVLDNGSVELKSPVDALRPAAAPAKRTPSQYRFGRASAPATPKGITSVPASVVAIKIEGRGKVLFLVKGNDSSLPAQSLYLESPYRVLSPADFSETALALKNTGQGAGMVGTAMLFARHAAEMQFVPPRLLEMVVNPQHKDRSFAESLAAMLWKFDLSEFGALYQAGNALQAEEIAKWVAPDSMLHLRKSWFAFRTVDDAVMAKVVRKDTSHIFPFA